MPLGSPGGALPAGGPVVAVLAGAGLGGRCRRYAARWPLLAGGRGCRYGRRRCHAVRMTALRPSAIAVLGMLRGRRVGPPAGAPVGRGDRHPDQPLDVAQEGAFLVIAERDRHAVGAGARGAADAVDVAFRDVRQIVVEHVADAVDVDAAGGDVGGDQGAQLAVTEVGEHALALVLRLVAVDRLGEKSGLFQAAHDLVGAVLGAGEHQHAVDRLALEQLGQQRRLGGLVGQDDALLRCARRWSPAASPRRGPDRAASGRRAG